MRVTLIPSVPVSREMGTVKVAPSRAMTVKRGGKVEQIRATCTEATPVIRAV